MLLALCTTYIVNETAIANFTYNVNNLSVDFTNTSQNADSYLWNFGDANTSSDFSPTHIYSAEGNYTVQLMATNSNNCDNTKSVNIDVITDIYSVKNNQYSIYPNPTNGKLNIVFNKYFPKSITIIDLTGKILVEYKDISKTNTFNVHKLQKGIYLLKFNYETSIATDKLIIE